MELMITGKNMEVTEAMRAYIERKLGRLEHYLADIDTVGVEVSQERTKSLHGRHVVQVTVGHKGTLLRGEERAGDVYAAIDTVSDVITRQLERYKGKLYNRKRQGSALRGGVALEEEPSRVVKTKRFAVKPMSVDEAVEQMELLGHDFFIFYNEDVGQFNVLYRRRDGDYGLIEPELG